MLVLLCTAITDEQLKTYLPVLHHELQGLAIQVTAQIKASNHVQLIGAEVDKVLQAPEPLWGLRRILCACLLPHLPGP